MTISKRLRYEILRRDNHTCRYCGAHAPDVPITVDHVIPVALGGTDDPANLAASCADCNSGKSATSPDAPLVDQVRADMLRWRDAVTVMAQVDHSNRVTRNERREWFTGQWDAWTWGPGRTFELPVSWPVTLDNLWSAGITIDDLADAIDQAMRTDGVRDRFRYFAGVCWRIVRDRQQRAARYLHETAEAGA